MSRAEVVARVPRSTFDWLTESENPAVAVMSRRHLLKESETPEMESAWARRNEYVPVSRILGAMRPDGSWLPPERDYKKYEGSLWQIHFLGELWAAPGDERVAKAAEYGFSRQLPDGSWSSNGRPAASAPCLTANVARALARMGFATDERILAAIAYLVDSYGTLGYLGCRDMQPYALNGYCHMLAPKVLLFLAEVPETSWPTGARELRDACVSALLDKEVFRSLPAEFKEFQAQVWSKPKAEMARAREAFLSKHQPLSYGDKPGWLRFGFPLSYNSDALEALWSLAAVAVGRRSELEAAIAAVEGAADSEMRWLLRNSFNGKMISDVEVKGKPSKWLTLRALRVLAHFG